MPPLLAFSTVYIPPWLGRPRISSAIFTEQLWRRNIYYHCKQIYLFFFYICVVLTGLKQRLGGLGEVVVVNGEGHTFIIGNVERGMVQLSSAWLAVVFFVSNMKKNPLKTIIPKSIHMFFLLNPDHCYVLHNSCSQCCQI